MSRQPWLVCSLAAALLIVGLGGRAVLTQTSYGRSLSPPRALSGISTVGVLRGRVLDFESGAPIAGAHVLFTHSGVPAAVNRTDTDSSGTFAIGMTGMGILHAEATGYLQPASDIGMRSVMAGDTGPMTLALTRAAQIAGVIEHTDGSPAVGLRVKVYRYLSSNPERVFSTSVPAVVTDAAGHYLVDHLRAGTYLISVPIVGVSVPVALSGQYHTELRPRTPHAPRSLEESFAPLLSGETETRGGIHLIRPAGAADSITTFYPASDAPERAELVTVRSGEVTWADLRPLTSSTIRVTGRVQTPNGAASGIALRLVQLTTDWVGEWLNDERAVAVTDASGAFTFFDVSPGTYAVHGLIGTPPRLSAPVSPSAPNPLVFLNQLHGWIGSEPLQVNDRDVDVPPLDVRLPLAVNGRVSLAGKAVKDVQLWAVPRRPAIEDRIDATSDGKGRFRMIVGLPGQFDLIMGRPGRQQAARLSRLYIEQISVGGVDVTNMPVDVANGDVTGVEIALGEARARTVVRAHAPDGTPRSLGEVLVFPADYAGWIADGMPQHRSRNDLFTQVGADANTCIFTNLPPGDYRMIAFIAAGRTFHALGSGSLLGPHDRRFIEAVAPMSQIVSVSGSADTTVDLPLLE